MEKKDKYNDNNIVARPPKHERVSEDLLIYALSNWRCPPDSCRHAPDAGDGQLALVVTLSGLIVLGALLLASIA